MRTVSGPTVGKIIFSCLCVCVTGGQYDKNHKSSSQYTVCNTIYNGADMLLPMTNMDLLGGK